MKVVIDPQGEAVVVTTTNNLTDIKRFEIDSPTEVESDEVIFVEPLHQLLGTSATIPASLPASERGPDPHEGQLSFGFPTE